jgi:hypothetical protein
VHLNYIDGKKMQERHQKELARRAITEKKIRKEIEFIAGGHKYIARKYSPPRRREV